MNLIGLDISKISTAMVIEKDGVDHIFSYNNKKKTYKWNKFVSELVNIKTYEYEKIEDYSELEISKLTTYLNIANDLIKDIKSVIDESQKTIIKVESFSYGSSLGPLIDLVGIAYIIRSKIYELIDNVEIQVIAPKSLKKMTAEMVYGFTEKKVGKRVIKIVKEVNKNPLGVSGGNFDKSDMFNAIMDSDLKSDLKTLYENNIDAIKSVKSFPKPLEDINDAYLLKEILKYNI